MPDRTGSTLRPNNSARKHPIGFSSLTRNLGRREEKQDFSLNFHENPEIFQATRLRMISQDGSTVTLRFRKFAMFAGNGSAGFSRQFSLSPSPPPLEQKQICQSNFTRDCLPPAAATSASEWKWPTCVSLCELFQALKGNNENTKANVKGCRAGRPVFQFLIVRQFYMRTVVRKIIIWTINVRQSDQAIEWLTRRDCALRRVHTGRHCSWRCVRTVDKRCRFVETKSNCAKSGEQAERWNILICFKEKHLQ